MKHMTPCNCIVTRGQYGIFPNKNRYIAHRVSPAQASILTCQIYFTEVWRGGTQSDEVERPGTVGFVPQIINTYTYTHTHRSKLVAHSLQLVLL